MDQVKPFQSQLKEKWNNKNSQGIILFRADTLNIRTLLHKNITLHLVHNSSRDLYDNSPRNLQTSEKEMCPFCGELDNELFSTHDGRFRILGNKFACMQYQSLLVPIRHQEVLNLETLQWVLEFAFAHPEIVLLYNSANAGKTVSHFYWLMSFYPYETLVNSDYRGIEIYKAENISIFRRLIPSYALEIQIKDSGKVVGLLFKLIEFMAHKNYNLFIYNNTVFFIPRENKDIPEGFGNHRFGGLEMIGTFIMKSITEYLSADPEKLLSGISQINYKEENQKKIETFLLFELS